MRSLVIAAALILLARVGLAQERHHVLTDAELAAMPENVSAITYCTDDQAVAIWFRPGVESWKIFPAIVVHEMVHVSQSQRYPTCWDWQDRFQGETADLKAIAEDEAEAYCASAKYMTDHMDWDWVDASNFNLNRLVMVFSSVPTPELIALWKKYCP